MDTKDQIIKKQKEIIEHYKFNAKKFNSIKWLAKLNWLESELSALKSQPSEPIQLGETNDLIQYVTNLLYAAYSDGYNNVESPQFDKWVNEKMDEMDEYFQSVSPEPVQSADVSEELIKYVKEQIARTEKNISIWQKADLSPEAKTIEVKRCEGMLSAYLLIHSYLVKAEQPECRHVHTIIDHSGNERHLSFNDIKETFSNSEITNTCVNLLNQMRSGLTPLAYMEEGYFNGYVDCWKWINSQFKGKEQVTDAEITKLLSDLEGLDEYDQIKWFKKWMRDIKIKS